jgi:hypothetical protein
MPPTIDSDNSPMGAWKEWSHYIINELKRLEGYNDAVELKLESNVHDLYETLNRLHAEQLAALRVVQDAHIKELNLIQIQLAMLRVKAGLWGLAAGALPVFITILIALVMHRLGVPTT